MKAIMFFLKIFTASTLTGNPIGFPLTPPPKKKTHTLNYTRKEEATNGWFRDSELKDDVLPS